MARISEVRIQTTKLGRQVVVFRRVAGGRRVVAAAASGAPDLLPSEIMADAKIQKVLSKGKS